MKRKISLFVLVFVLGLLLTGCGSSDKAADYYGDEYYGDEYSSVDGEDGSANAPDISDTDGTDVPGESSTEGGDVIQSAAIPALEDRKIIYTARLKMNSETPSDIYNSVIDSLDTYSAYVESADITTTRYIVYIRVLSENFTEFVEEIKTTGEVVSFSKTSEDVTNSYSTFEARKLALETQHTRILELIEEAVNLEDILTLEDARFEIETELNQIGSSLANYDSLVDFSTVILTINKVTEEEVVLPKSSSPIVKVLEVTKDTIDLEVHNSSEQSANIYVDLLLNGEFIRQYEETTYGDSTVVFEIDDLKSFKEYTFKVTSITADHRESNVVSRYTTTEKTFINEVANIFIISFNSLVSIVTFLSLAVVAILPYAIVGVALFFPVRILYKKFRIKFSKKERIIEKQDDEK
jgi:hypothetical protein